MNTRIARIVLSLIVGSIGVAIGLYFGRFPAGGVGFLFRSSLQAISLATGVTWWAFIGLIGGLGLALSTLNKRRVRFVALSVVGFAAGGALAALLVSSSADRTAATATLAVPLGGALAGLVMGLSAGLGSRSVLILIVGALAMAIGGPYIDPRSSAIPPFDVIALLAPGALIGAALAAWAPDDAAAAAPA
jgi:hypothetical protein